MSSQTRWIESTITPAESIRVPSQSKINRSNCLGILQVIQESGQFGRQRRLNQHALAGNGMLEAQLGGVQGHPLQSLLHPPLVEFEIAVFVVLRDRRPEML